MDNVRKFPLCTVLTVTTGRLLTKRKSTNDNGISDLHEILEHMIGETPFTHTLGSFADKCKPWLLFWFPELDSNELWSEVEKLSWLLSGFSKNTNKYVKDAVVVKWLNSLVAKGICSEKYDIGQIGEHIESKNP